MRHNVKKTNIYVLMLVGFFIYSFSSIFTKLASREELFSVKYCIFYVSIIFILGIYAIIWQQVLKHIDLSIALSYKPIVIVFHIIWSTLIFHEQLTLKIIVGISFIIFGIYMVGSHEG